MEAELRAYRACPNDRRFAAVYRAAEPWLTSSAMRIVSKYRQLSQSSALDDVRVEGALTLSTAAKRFVYFCDVCGSAHLTLARLERHYREVHRVRGAPAVALATFVKTSSDLVMKRTARRLVRQEILEPEIELGVDHGAEQEILSVVLVKQFGSRIHARARQSLRSILSSVYDETDVRIVRERVISHLG